MAYETIEVRPIAGALGAEVSGADLSAPLGNQVFAEIHQAFLDYQVVFFRDQTLTPEQQKTFTRRFGPFGETPFVTTLPDHPEIIEVVKETDDRTAYNFGGNWHSDFSFQPQPPMATVLYSREVPPYGGDTLFANMYLAYETLTPGMRRIADDLIGIHSARRSYSPAAQYQHDQLSAMEVKTDDSAYETVEHPVVRTHPETGRKALFINKVYTVGLKGFSKTEGAALLDLLCRHAERPELTCRFSWTQGALAMWDNRCVQHFAVNDYDGYRRVMHRTTIAGEPPV